MADYIEVFDKDGTEQQIAYLDLSGVKHQKNILYNADGDAITHTNRALDVSIQDAVNRPIETNFYNYLKSVTLVSPGTPMTFETSEFTLASTTGLTVGDMFFLNEDGRQFESFITGINAGTGVITVDRAINYIYSYDATAFIGRSCICVDGRTTNKVFKIQPPDGATWDINKIVLMLQDNVSMDDSKFGGLDALTNGIVLRAYYNYSGGVATRSDIFCVAKTNFELGLSFNSIQYDDRAGGSGLYGMKAVKTFNSNQHNGVTIRLDGSAGDNIQIIVRDELTGLAGARCVAHGHETIITV